MNSVTTKATSVPYLAAALLLAYITGCQKVPYFPEHASRVTAQNGQRTIWYNLDGNEPDYRQIFDAKGRKVELQFVLCDDSNLEHVSLDAVEPDTVPHVIIALDGVPYHLVEELYEQGRFRLFHPPARVISCFPCMTDLAFWRIFGGQQPRAYQALYFDPQTNCIAGGNTFYMSGGNADWTNKLAYRMPVTFDGFAYLSPQSLLEGEMKGILETVRKTDKGTIIAYSIATAGWGTQQGREGIIEYLRLIDRLCEQIVYERRGRVNISLLADHGHNLSGRGRVSFTNLLKRAGFRPASCIKEEHDVVTVKYGLVTYAAFFTPRPADVAQVLLADPVTTIACYKRDDSIVVESVGGKAIIEHHEDKYRYRALYGDPLELKDILRQLEQNGQIDADSFVNDDILFQATVTHLYPDPLRRIWLAFHGLVEMNPDLIVCLQDGWCHGSKAFDILIGGAVSTAKQQPPPR